jgi:hypothetical protein
MQPNRANQPNGYLLGTYRIATAPEPNSSRLTSLKSRLFDSPANKRWAPTSKSFNAAVERRRSKGVSQEWH